MQSKATGNEYRTTLVCVDDYERQVMSGRLYNPFCSDQRFHSTMDFLEQMEELLDNMKCPQPFMTARSFSDSPERAAESPPGSQSRTGKLGTFAVRVIFRQNASWQGSVTWLEGGQEQSFRSVLELLLMMDGALRGASAGTPKQISVG